VRVDDADETHGLHESLHGERAYLEAAWRIAPRWGETGNRGAG
jgi:hypothetical protein